MSQPTAIGYATMRQHIGGHEGRIVLALREVAGRFRWAGADGESFAPLVIAPTRDDAIKQLGAVYGPYGLALYPIRTDAERAAAIAADVLTPATGELTAAESEAWTREHCTTCQTREAPSTLGSTFGRCSACFLTLQSDDET